MAETPSLKATDLLAVRSRVSWGAIAAGAMVALSIYMILTLLGLALGIEAALSDDPRVDIGAGAAIYSILALLLSMFFGGWATSRLAVGETKLEAVLYGVILWGFLFFGLFWLIGAGVRVGFGAIIGVASGAYGAPEGGVDVDRMAADLKRAGADDQTVDKVRGYYRRVEGDPGALPEVAGEAANRNRGSLQQAAQRARQAAWWSLIGVLISMGTVVFGSLVGSGDVPVPVPVLGVRRPRDPRA